MTINLTSMKEHEFKKWALGSQSRFAADKMKYNSLTKNEADKIASDTFNKILPEGFHSKNNFLYFVTAASPEPVGYLWYCLSGDEDNQKAWVCDIRVEEAFRRQGFGHKTMVLLEEDVKKKNINRIGLHVFAYNEVAVKLYKSLGYDTTDLSMEKTI